jgi:POLQ-like helicase
MNSTGGLQMKPEGRSRQLLGVTRSKAKMFEYGVPEEHHIKIPREPERLFTLAIGLLGDLAARTNSENVDKHSLDELRANLQFSAHFFDAYLESRLKEELRPYLLLLGAAAYYLCDFPGSSRVLAKRLGGRHLDLDCLGLENLLCCLLQGDLSTYVEGTDGLYGECIEGISRWLVHFFHNGTEQEYLFNSTSHLRETAYNNGTPRQLLFADIICAIVKMRFENSTWYCLPKYSELSREQWMHVLRKGTFIRELWPAQHLLGKHGVFRGKSAVVQMPTSAGKTKATEIIIRSAFLANRTSLAIIVAPFRALCHEIRNSLVEAFHDESVNIDELSDVLQADFEIAELLGRKQVLVVTPEKLIYVLRHSPELAKNIGLLIYDEGHQFDSDTRGINYELLLTSLKSMVPKTAQTVLISAVISNAVSIGNWLNGEGSEVVSGTNLTPTYRTVAFASWLDQLGRLEFVDQDNPDNGEFFVPRIIEKQQLQLRGKERKQRAFPEKTDGQAIALFLGLKLACNGSVAIFCGKKNTALSMCEKVVDSYDRGINFTKPIEFSDQKEVHRLHFLHLRNLGKEATATKCAEMGIFSHHGNIPHGIRLAIEYAMKEGKAKFVICTSTLAQGVNLPIRYLIVTSVYQGSERIKVRDFHNLIGRAGRSGMHTEGSILFADPEVYDRRYSSDGRWQWRQVKDLLSPDKSEQCVSSLLSLFSPLTIAKGRQVLQIDWLQHIRIYVEASESLDSITTRIVSEYGNRGVTVYSIEEQIKRRLDVIASVESYLMAQWDDSESGLQEERIEELAKQTLAYFLADDEKQGQIVELCKLLAQNIKQHIQEVPKRKIYGKTLFGVRASIEIEKWVTEHIDDIFSCKDHDELLSTLWPIVADKIRNNTFKKCDPLEVLRDVAMGWIHGKPFQDLYEILSIGNARLISGTQRRHFKLDHLVDICENALAYDGTLVIGAVAELTEFIRPSDAGGLISKLQKLQKRLKYGLPSSSAIILYELGFADRIVAMDLGNTIGVTLSDKQDAIRAIKRNEQNIRKRVEKYPSYFIDVFENLIE